MQASEAAKLPRNDFSFHPLDASREFVAEKTRHATAAVPAALSPLAFKTGSGANNAGSGIACMACM